ncbi:IMP cyclohydrolase [Candidatus Woesearchaeota archaeon]|nr:IMP cyclohydrolase [Candidatus Woesearchaeota archaeon]
MKDTQQIKTAIISCYDKQGLNEFASELAMTIPDIRIYSSGGTYRQIQEAAKGKVTEIAAYTGFPEMPSGLVKTLHPKVHAGILADKNDAKQAEYLKQNGIETFDMVIVNLYPFEKAVAEGADMEEARKNIDIGGVSLIEAAAKNFKRVTVVCDAKDYGRVMEEIKKGGVSGKTRLELAKKAFKYLAQYLKAVSSYFEAAK